MQEGLGGWEEVAEGTSDDGDAEMLDEGTTLDSDGTINGSTLDDSLLGGP